MSDVGEGQVQQRTTLTEPHRTWAPPANFHALLEAELGYLRKVVRRWHQEPANAEDLVHDTILLALASAQQWQQGSSLRAWLFTIMRNRFFATVARSQRSLHLIDAICVATMNAGIEREKPETRLIIRDVERALSRLSSDQRSAIRLIAIEGRSYDEAARLMGMSVAAVRCHLSRARERLKGIVQGEERRHRARAVVRTGCAVAVLETV